MRAPGDVRPGHITFAPLRINLIAPLSTCMGGNMNGSAQTNHIVLVTVLVLVK